MSSLTKEKTALVIPNAIKICTETDKHFFCSFGARDKTYVVLFRTWQQALLDQVSISPFPPPGAPLIIFSQFLTRFAAPSNHFLPPY